MKCTVRFLVLLTSLLLLALWILPASADVIFEPNDNFYENHREDCTYDNRKYRVNTDVGYAYLYQNPESSLSVGPAHSNEETVHISHLYTAPNGEVWGIPHSYEGWFRMSDLTLIYDSRSFLEEYRSACKPYTKGSYTIEVSEEKPVIFWAYPGGERGGEFPFPEFINGVDQSYTDEDGRVWGHVTYAYGIRDVWVCLSDPYNTEAGGWAVEENKNRTPLKAAPVPQAEIPMNDGNRRMLAITGGLVAVVVLGTVALLIVLRCKRNRE